MKVGSFSLISLLQKLVFSCIIIAETALCVERMVLMEEIMEQDVRPVRTRKKRRPAGLYCFLAEFDFCLNFTPVLRKCKTGVFITVRSIDRFPGR